MIDASINFDWTGLGRERWTMLKGGLIVNVTWEQEPMSLAEQKVIDRLVVEVFEDGKTTVFKTEKIDKIIFPQEFLELVEKNGKFEFLGGITTLTWLIR